MSDNNSGSSSGGGISFLGLLTVLFIGLKLTNYISWSWWWILAPMWIPTLIGLILIIIAALLTFMN